MAKSKGSQPSQGKLKKLSRMVQGGKELSDEQLKMYWSARAHDIPPALKTSFGNYTCINSVCRVVVPTSTTATTCVVVGWFNSSMRLLATNDTTTAAYISTTGALQGCGAYAIRPLRLSFRLSNISPTLTREGNVRIGSFDEALAINFTTGSAAGNAITIPTATTVSLAATVKGAPHAATYTAEELAEPQEFVSVPASYISYNTYVDFAPVATSGAVGALDGMSGTDAQNMFRDTDWAPGTANAFALSTSTLYSVRTNIADVPKMRTFVLIFPPTVAAQNYEIAIHSQDGCRFQANTLGAAFSIGAGKPLTTAAEDKVLRSIRAVSSQPASPLEHFRDFVAAGQSAVQLIEGAAGQVAKLMPYLPTAMKYGKAML